MFLYLQLLTELMHLYLNKLTSKCGKMIVQIFLYTLIYIYIIHILYIYVNLKKSQSSFPHSFLAIFPQ